MEKLEFDFLVQQVFPYLQHLELYSLSLVCKRFAPTGEHFRLPGDYPVCYHTFRKFGICPHCEQKLNPDHVPVSKPFCHPYCVIEPKLVGFAGGQYKICKYHLPGLIANGYFYNGLFHCHEGTALGDLVHKHGNVKQLTAIFDKDMSDIMETFQRAETKKNLDSYFDAHPAFLDVDYGEQINLYELIYRYYAVEMECKGNFMDTFTLMERRIMNNVSTIKSWIEYNLEPIHHEETFGGWYYLLIEYFNYDGDHWDPIFFSTKSVYDVTSKLKRRVLSYTQKHFQLIIDAGINRRYGYNYYGGVVYKVVDILVQVMRSNTSQFLTLCNKPGVHKREYLEKCLGIGFEALDNAENMSYTSELKEFITNKYNQIFN